ncbi:hypothetical protein NONO_c73250 [Nocardia nova SH22a]|uniref:Uncharacterized protein n=1 Tax=Nocardia nova SH22a TaxID=1415166 RepID=W5TXX8_9NOCA|nr:hypothetical protein [Nocardia nova]AHH22081.1 hypothetical protein NONO_c73250 [Nocardia nova SH22a]
MNTVPNATDAPNPRPGDAYDRYAAQLTPGDPIKVLTETGEVIPVRFWGHAIVASLSDGTLQTFDTEDIELPEGVAPVSAATIIAAHLTEFEDCDLGEAINALRDHASLPAAQFMPLLRAEFERQRAAKTTASRSLGEAVMRLEAQTRRRRAASIEGQAVEPRHSHDRPRCVHCGDERGPWRPTGEHCEHGVQLFECSPGHGCRAGDGRSGRAAKAAGMACIRCGADLAAPGAESVPGGFGDRGQVFRCAAGTGCQAEAVTFTGDDLFGYVSSLDDTRGGAE